MPQLYFLSIIFNFLAGLILIVNGKKAEANPAADNSAETERDEAGQPGKVKKVGSIQDIADNAGFQFFIGIVAFIIGLFKLLAAYDGIVIIGDLLPAAAGIILGGMLFMNYFKSTSQVSSELLDKLDQVFLQNKKYFAAAGMGIAILHFIFPQFVLL